jgi:hypothetical protein
VTQWAKQQACWEGFKRVHVKLNDVVEGDLITATQAHLQAADDRKERAMDSGFESVKRVLAVSPQAWATIYGATSQVPMSPTEKSLVELFGLRRGRVPSDRQAAVLLRLFDRMVEHGVISRDSYP